MQASPCCGAGCRLCDSKKNSLSVKRRTPREYLACLSVMDARNTGCWKGKTIKLQDARTGQLPLQDVGSAVRSMPWCLSLVCQVQQQQRSCC